MKTNLYLLKVALVLKLSRLGFNAGICHRCGKIFDREESETLCKECKTHTQNIKNLHPFSNEKASL